MKAKWIYQHEEYPLGNFINITPIIRWLFEQTEKPVPVFFETDYVREAYKDEPMIKVLKAPYEHKPVVSSRCHCVDNTQPDWEYNFEHITGGKYTEAYKPFIPASLPQKKAVIVLGSGSEDSIYLKSKIPPAKDYVEIIKKLKELNYRIIFTGSRYDLIRASDMIHHCDCSFIGDICHSIDMIRSADIVIGNDTGLIHVAGCFNIPTYVMWVVTPFPRCKDSGDNSWHSNHDYQDLFNQFIKEFDV